MKSRVLNKEGARGWELVAITNTGNYNYYYFKRKTGDIVLSNKHSEYRNTKIPAFEYKRIIKAARFI